MDTEPGRAPGPEQAAWSIRRTLADVLDEVVAT
jgi:hypothetical protein